MSRMPSADVSPAMIFHVPFRLNPDATSASGIRPMRMRRAFEALGYDVLEVSGRHRERRSQMRAIRKRILAGLPVKFVYSEASTAPTGLGEKVTPATSLTRDVKFLRFCRRSGIPVGLFYRDIYWRDQEYANRVGRVLAALMRWRYHADLRGYRNAVDRIFVPSMRMAREIPHIDPRKCAALPPASDIVDVPEAIDPATMFYVGALGHYYKLHEAVRAFESVDGAVFTLCTSAALWEKERGGYTDLMTSGSTRVVHASGKELEPLYADSALGCLFMAPIEYREFAAPMKLYEYLGHGRPIVATEGSLAAQFVEQNDVGWVLPYSAVALRDLVEHLRAHPSDYRVKAERARIVRNQHTWSARASQVASALIR